MLCVHENNSFSARLKSSLFSFSKSVNEVHVSSLYYLKYSCVLDSTLCSLNNGILYINFI